MVCQVSTVSPKETCSSWGSFQTPVDNTVPSPAGVEGYRRGLSVPPRPLHVQSSCTRTPAQHFGATWVVFTQGQQLLLMCIHEGQSQSFLPQLQSRCFTSSLSVLVAEALEMIFMVAKHSNAAIAEMVRPCLSWKCFAAHSTVPLKETRALWVQL